MPGQLHDDSDMTPDTAAADEETMDLDVEAFDDFSDIVSAELAAFEIERVLRTAEPREANEW